MRWRPPLLLAVAACCVLPIWSQPVQILTPGQVTISHRKPVTATSTCGEINGQPIKEAFCSIAGSYQYSPFSQYSYQDSQDSSPNPNPFQEARNAREAFSLGGHGCGHCDASSHQDRHPAEYMVDGRENWWQSPPLSRGMQYNKVNITIDLEQEFHVAYVWIQMANSPKPSTWILERSTDYGKTFQPWFYFAENAAECMRRFGVETLSPITEDQSVICRTDFSSIQPLDNAEIVINLLENRPSRLSFATSEELQNFTRATNVRIRLLGARTLQGHLMDLNEKRDPSVTRRYFYAIKEVLMGGRCVCNGHASTCDILDPKRPRALLCRCEHNTCGDMCDKCCPGFEQKKWQPTTAHNNFTCEPCNCFGRSNECVYEEDLAQKGLSLDVNGNYEGGGRCLNCREHTTGINCNQCEVGFYRPEGVSWDALRPCKACECDPTKHTGACEEGTGRCECQARFEGEDCDRCAKGYYDAPECKKCECMVDGTVGEACLPTDGQCPCKEGYGGVFCETCSPGYTNVTAGCVGCECSDVGSEHKNCSAETGQCVCKSAYSGLACDQCQLGYFGFPDCTYCNCDPIGTEGGQCDSQTGQCLCKPGFVGERCDKCDVGFYGYPNCRSCECDGAGARTPECDSVSGQCPCFTNFTSRACDKCAAGFYDYPNCKACSCLIEGAKGQTCDNNGQCYCKGNFEGERCDRCKPNHYNFPACEECNCNPSGVTQDFAGCDKVAPGELCSCREHVTGRICDQCKPTFWDLQYHHPGGCVSCNCSLAGTISQTNSCDQKSGQCECKRNAGGRQCDECAPGYYNLQPFNQQGCEPCNCDVGGSIRSECNGQTGQCRCRPRITGLRCDKPIENHYFPMLWHNQYEAEDGHTEDNKPVRFAVDQTQFPEYSWRGYAVFSPIQEKIFLDIDITKSSVYRLLFKFHNPTTVPITAQVTVDPRTNSIHDQEQTEKVTFAPTTDPSIKEVTVNGKPFVMNPGRWSLSVATKQRLFLDYVVVLPVEYYEATSLRVKGTPPCKAHTLKETICVDLLYPPMQESARVDLASGEFKNVNDDGTTSVLEPVPVEILPEIVGKAAFIRTDTEGRVIEAEFQVPEDNEYAMILEYHHLAEKNFPINVELFQDGESLLNGSAVVHHCPYATFCRELVTDRGIIPFVPFKAGTGSVQIRVPPQHEFGLAAIVLIKKSDWSNDYLQQVPNCVRKYGKCLSQEYPSAASAIVAEAESGPGQAHAINADKLPFEVSDPNNVFLVRLDAEKGTLDIPGVVPTRGHYKFLVHYYNPDNAPFDMSVLLQYHDQFAQAVVPLTYCPSVSGCRALIRDKEKPEIQQFFIEDKYTATFYFNDTQQGPIYIDSVTAVPYSSFSEALMTPLPVDLSSDFATQCSDNFYHNHPSNATNFCKEKIFSLTSEFNSAAFPCECNARGSESFACEEYGGQCKCKNNVIGRKCERCAPGYYNFPECIKCKCGTSQQCDELTGQCFCPPHVEGTSCDRCVGYAFGFDPLIGCQPCGCHPQGSDGGAQQCDAESGQCLCRESVGGRQCDRCLAGFYGFPSCYSCRCETSGTTDAICDATSAACQCKENVVGQRCDSCKSGTFDLSKENPLGCADCFCFGITEQCRSSFFHVQIGAVDMSAFTVTDPAGKVTLDNEETYYESAEDSPASVYFNAPINHGADYTSSYGLTLSFKLSVSPKEDSRKMSTEADVRLHGGNNLTAEFWATEQPSDPEETFAVRVKLVPENFLAPSGKSFTREDLMMLLHSLKNITIKASYFESPQSARLVEFGLETSSPSGDSVIKASSVEQCNCPAPYQGPSCQQCAPGYYRVAGGSYLGSCVPCDCNGHSGSCDPDTGICFDCEDNTHGEHCEFCDEGHYGNATTGSPYSCMPCACPYTEAGNNFATSCETSEYGEVLSCKCKPGYTGERCERCDAGHFGEPTRPGGNCQQCSCNGNNNLTDPRSCHPHTGDCYLCENNTNGRHCEWCDNWFYGDAVEAKNCTSCACDQCGSSRCDNQSGNCECKPNVVGEDCDRCAPDHWGFSRCNGCHACHCAVAASSGQCHGETGQCACRPGAAGLRCEHCEQGYWNYGEHGCTKCDCEADLSMGTVCDVRTGQCHCQEGATGARCDQCERSYLRIPTLGCRRCDECVFHLIADLNALDVSVNAVNRSMSNISSATLVGARISRNRKMLTEISELSQLLTNTDSEYNNLIGDAKGAVIERTNQLATANRSITFAIRDVDRVHNLTENATAIVQKIRDTAEYARFIVDSVRRLTESIGSTSTALEIDPRFLEEAQKILMDLESTTAMDKPEKIETTKATLAKLEEKIKEQKAKLDSQKERLESTRKQDSDFADTLASAQQYLKKTKLMSEDVSRRSRDQTLFKLNGLSKAIQSDLDKVAEERELVKNALLEANNKTEMAKDAAESISTLIDSVEEARDTLNKAAENKRVRREAGVDRVALKIRVDELKQEADRLNGTFGSTRLESESAVEAASAYENLTNSLINARNTATETTDLAKGQKDSLTEMKVQVETALSESQRLKEEAGRLKTEAEDLSKKAQEKEREVDSLADQVDTMRKTRNQLHESLKSPLTSSSDSIQEKTDQVHTMSADIQAALEENKEKLEKTKADAETAFSARAGATQDVKTTRSNIKDLGILKPKLLAAFEAMKTAASERKTKMDGMKDKMAQVKEMIAVARDAANRIRLGAHFERGSSLDLNIPHRVSRSAAHTDISFYFRTGVEHGIPLFFGNEEGSAGTRAVPTDDYIAVEVEYGKPKVTIDLGDEPLVVSLDTKVSDMLWRRIDVRRIGKSATVSLTKAGSDEVGEKKQSVSDGNKSVLNLHQTISKLFVGGTPRNSRIAREIRNRDFEGDIEELLLHGEPVGLWNTRSKGMTNVQGSPKRPRNTDNVENLGVSLNGEGYIVHELGHWNPRKRTVLSLQFLTYSPDGLLFFVGKEREFMTLELSDGAVKLSVDFGSGVGSWQSDRNNLNDGEWHTVSVIRDGIHVKLGVDAETVADDNAPEGNAELSVSQNFYLGGVPTSVHLRTTVEPLRGCLRSIRLNSDDVDLQGRGVRASKGVRNSCPLGTVSTVSILSDRASAIFNNISTNGEAEVTLRFKTTMNSTATLFTVKTEEDDLLSLSFEDGTMTAASGDDKLTLEVSDINDEMWHFVSVKKNKQYLRIDVDDLHSKQTDRNNGEDAKPGETVQILFGKQGSGKFVGCVGDVTFNGQLLDFSKAIVNEVSLTGCSLRDDVIRTTVAPTTMSTDEVTTPTDGPKTIAEPGEETSSPTLTPAGLAQTTAGPVVTLAPIPRPEGSCALPKTPRGGFNDSDGTRFGAAANSHLEYLEIPDAFDKKGTFSLQVRATAASGVIFLATNEKQTDHVALFIMDGKLVFSYDAGAGQVLVKSSRSILDGQWHSVRATRNMEEAHLVVDDDSTDVTSVKGNSPIDTDAPLYVGGVPADLTAYVKTLLNVKSEFGGCIRDLKLNEKRFDQEPKEFNTVPCQAFYEHGIFFGPDGGHVILKKEYHIGQTFAADLEIRPRTDNAILLSVGKVEYLTVQIINGSIKFIVDSGAGADVMVYTPPENNGLCDGHWHSIKIMKKKNLMTLTVDGKSNLQIMKKNKKPDTVTNDPIYLGGVPEGVTNQGLATKENYVGCVRIVNYGDKKSRVIRRKKQLDIASMETFGDVNKEECPVN